MRRTVLLGFAALVSAMGATDPHSIVPLVYFPNYGQEHAAVHYAARSGELTAYFLSSEVAFLLRGRIVRMQFPGATGPRRIEPAQQLPGVANFLRGAEEEWRTGVPLYNGIVYRRLYPGIDMRFGSDVRSLKSEFVVAPGADPYRIRVRYDGADRLYVETDGSLVIQVGDRELREQPPILYQQHGPDRVAVDGSFVISGDVVSFRIGDYDPLLPLVIDPVVTYSTLLGGSGSDAALSLAVDAAGAAYIAGLTASSDFPTANAEQSWNAGGNEVFVAKLTPAGNALAYCTYIGGRGDDRAYAIAVDSTGAAYVAGSTTSANFPLRNALQTKLAGGRNAFVLKLNPAGNSLVYSTYLGGSAADGATGIALGSDLSAYVTGDATSANFPTTGLQRTSAGSQDAFVAKLSADGSRLMYSTYLGGSSDDHAAGIAVDTNGTAYVSGSTWSANFPVMNAYQSKLAGGQDAFVARLAANGASLLFSTYLGGSGGNIGSPETGQGIALDAQGNVYVAGVTASSDFPVLGAAQSTNQGWQDAFVAKLAPAGILLYSTYLGGSGIDQANAIAVDATGSAYVAGHTTSVDLAAAVGLQNPNPGQYEVFVTRLSAAGNSLMAAVYMGGGDADTATAITVDASSNAYIAGWTLSTGFPLVNPIQSINAGNYGAFVAKIGFATPVPSVNGVSPNSGSGNSQTFTFQFSDTAGAGDLTTTSALFNSTLNVANACAVTYTRLTNTLALFTDAGASPGTPITPGSGTQQNSQCVLSGTGSSVTIVGSTLTLKLALTFQAAFGGARNIYSQAVNPQSSTGWQQVGTWTVSSPGRPTAGPLTPVSGSGASQTFSAQFTNAGGAAAFTGAYMLINSGFDARNSCYVGYLPAGNGLYLLNDAATAWSGPITPGSSSTLQNSQCTLNASGSSATIVGNTLTMNASLTFKPAFAGMKTVFIFAYTATGDTGFQTGGTWTVSSPGPPTAGPLTPASGSGLSQTFSVQYANPSGAAAFTSAYMLINSGFDARNACYVGYLPAGNGLYLLNDAATAWAGPITPGSSATLQNSQCTLNASGSSATIGGNTLTMNASLTFKPAFTGMKTVFLFAYTATGDTGFQTGGTWTVPAAAGPPTAGPLSPASGSGASQTFSVQYANPAGAAAFTSAYMLINSGFDARNACYVGYQPAGNGLYLLNDAATAWSGPITPGSSATLQNSQCTLNASGSSATIGGNTLTMNSSLTFRPAFAGMKTVFVFAYTGVADTGFQIGGSWTSR